MISRRTARETWTPTDLHSANLAQRRQLLKDAAPQDLEDLIPILDARAREARAAAQRAEDELAEALLAKQERASG